ncbi:hypothetical protein [Desulfonatronovibrio hydrogenovorans]|uniref:hypothetical protein n=1 Tax=Desulfonatronovibrio hydrogenovorans TaxID=53245 RepID=UPI00048C7C1D|nr:hypothetical protein [Desulfonatronovibrio hydrogenovorans]
MDAIEQLSLKIDDLLEIKHKLEQENLVLKKDLESERHKNNLVLGKVNDLLQKIDDETAS